MSKPIYFLLQLCFFINFGILSELEIDKQQKDRVLPLGVAIGVTATITFGLITMLKKQPLINWENDQKWEERFLKLYNQVDLLPENLEKPLEDFQKVEQTEISIKIINLLFDTYVQDIFTNCLRVTKIYLENEVSHLNEKLNTIKKVKDQKKQLDISNFKMLDQILLDNSNKSMKIFRDVQQGYQTAKNNNSQHMMMCQDFSNFIWEHIHLTKFMFDIEGAFFYFKEYVQKYTINEKEVEERKQYQLFIDYLDKFIYEINEHEKSNYFKTFYYSWLNFYINDSGNFNLEQIENQIIL